MKPAGHLTTDRSAPRSIAKLSVVIVNWNSRDYLRRCLASLRPHLTSVCCEIIVVDGASFDGCGEMLAAEFPEVVFVQSRENIGFGACNNLGFKRATGNALLLLNPDTEIQTGFSEYLAALGRLPDAGIVGPRLLNSDGTLQTSCVQAQPTPLNQAVDSELLRRLFPCSPLWNNHAAFCSSEPTSVEAVSGACMLLWSDTFRRAGGFSRDFFMYSEDIDLCTRVRNIGLRVYHLPTTKVVHHGSGSAQKQVNQFSTVMMRLACEKYMRRNYGRGTAFNYRLLQALSALVRCTFALPVWILAHGCRRVAAQQTTKKWLYVLRWACLGRELTPEKTPASAPAPTR